MSLRRVGGGGVGRGGVGRGGVGRVGGGGVGWAGGGGVGRAGGGGVGRGRPLTLLFLLVKESKKSLQNKSRPIPFLPLVMCHCQSYLITLFIALNSENP